MLDVVADVKTDPNGPTDDAARLTRRERAERTRRRIRGAARELFTEHGYAGTTMEAIADGADVAVQTVYFVFHTKAELFGEVFERAVLGEDDPVPPHLSPWWQAMADAERGADAIAHLVCGVSEIARRTAPLLRTVHGAASEPEVQQMHAHHEELRYDGYADVIAVLDDRFGLREGTDRRTARDVLFTLLGPEPYLRFVLDLGWSHERYVDWLAELLTRELLAER